jgi:hypothetical protein
MISPVHFPCAPRPQRGIACAQLKSDLGQLRQTLLKLLPQFPAVNLAVTVLRKPFKAYQCDGSV